MKRPKVIRKLDGAMTVESWPTGVAGLSIVPFVWLNEVVQPGWYRLSHDASGLAFPAAWPSKAAVRRCAAAVADVVDWRRLLDAEDLRPVADALRAACRAEGLPDAELWWRLAPEERAAV